MAPSAFRADLTDSLHRVHRGELAAVDAYQRAVGDLDDRAEPGVRAILDQHLREHREAAAVLENHLEARGEEADEDAGVWGRFTSAVEEVASWMGGSSELDILREGEVHGLSEYRTLLGHEDLPGALRQEIEGRLVPRQEAHVRALERLTARDAGQPG